MEFLIRFAAYNYFINEPIFSLSLIYSTSLKMHELSICHELQRVENADSDPRKNELQNLLDPNTLSRFNETLLSTQAFQCRTRSMSRSQD